MNKSAFRIDFILLMLVFLNVALALASFFYSSKLNFNDQQGYVNMAIGLSKGLFSTWNTLPIYYPETLRTWGYPLFLNILFRFSENLFWIKLAQFVLYLLSIVLGMEILRSLVKSIFSLRIYFFLTSICVQISYYTGIVSSEMLTVFSTICYVYIIICRPKSFLWAILAGIVASYCFSVRPSFLLFPILLILCHIFWMKSNLKYWMLQFVVYVLLLLPFGYWNYTNHGVFKLTPLEGGAGLFHNGFWGDKLPDGYNESFYWDNRFRDNFIQLELYSEAESDKFKDEYENEWKNLLVELEKYESVKDKEVKQIMLFQKQFHGGFILHNSLYTLERERKLIHLTLLHIKNEPMYYLQTRIFAFFRIYVSGIPKSAFIKANGMGKIYLIIPFVVTFFVILLGIFYSMWGLFYYKTYTNSSILTLFLLILYQGLIHLPFSTQARYSIPVHLIVLILISFYITFKKSAVVNFKD